MTHIEQRQWNEQGFLILRSIIPSGRLLALQAVFEQAVENMLNKLIQDGKISDTKSELPFDRRFAEAAGTHANQFGRSWRSAIASRALFDLQSTTALVDAIAQLTGTDVLGHPAFNGRPKLPQQKLTEVPWHQDASYFGDTARSALILTCWIPLVPATRENGCMQILPGTQQQPHRKHLAEQTEAGFLQADMEGLDESKAVTCEMLPGDVLIFNNLTLHRSLPSTAPTIRWSVDLRYIRDGDPGANMGAVDPNFKWVIRSETQPAMPFETWFTETQRWSW